VLVLGLGNILLRDEGVGVHVVRALEQASLPPEMELCDGATAGLDLLDVLADRRKVVVIDALGGDSSPGTVLRLSGADLTAGTETDRRAGPSAAAVSLHELGFVEALWLARRLGLAPPDVVVIGVRPYDIGWGLELSPEMARLAPRLVELVLAELEA
jgi:hydrogenase maturation protease